MFATKVCQDSSSRLIPGEGLVTSNQTGSCGMCSWLACHSYVCTLHANDVDKLVTSKSPPLLGKGSATPDYGRCGPDTTDPSVAQRKHIRLYLTSQGA